MIFIRKANLVPWYLLFLLICSTEKLEEFPEDIIGTFSKETFQDGDGARK